MIARLTGVVMVEEADGSAILDVSGVGYDVTLPLGAIGRARKEDDGRTTLYIHTHATREEAAVLFGFPSIEEKTVFRTILSVPNVGPKTALAILGALSIPDLASAIARNDLSRLTSISGVGKKTAERLVLELKDKLLLHAGSSVSAGKSAALPTANVPLGKSEQLRGALSNMGFRPTEVDRALEQLRDRVASTELPDLLRESLGFLRR